MRLELNQVNLSLKTKKLQIMGKSRLFNDNGGLNFSPERGRHYLIARGNTVVREIFYDKDAKAAILPWVPLIPLFEQVHNFRMQFKQLMTEQKAIQKGLVPLLTYEVNVKEKGEAVDQTRVQKMCLVERDEVVHFINDLETHAFTIEIRTPDGGFLKFVFAYALKMHSAMTAVADFPQGFLVYAERRLVAKVGGILRAKSFDVLSTITDEDLDINKQDVMDLLSQEFQPHGFTLPTLMLETIIVKASSQDRVDEQENKEITRIKNEARIDTAKTDASIVTIAATATSTADKTKAEGKSVYIKQTGTAEADVLKAKLIVALDFITKNKALIDKTSEITTKNLSYLKGVLVSGKELSSSDETLINTIIANSIQNNQNS